MNLRIQNVIWIVDFISMNTKVVMNFTHSPKIFTSVSLLSFICQIAFHLRPCPWVWECPVGINDPPWYAPFPPSPHCYDVDDPSLRVACIFVFFPSSIAGFVLFMNYFQTCFFPTQTESSLRPNIKSNTLFSLY